MDLGGEAGAVAVGQFQVREQHVRGLFRDRCARIGEVAEGLDLEFRICRKRTVQPPARGFVVFDQEDPYRRHDRDITFRANP